MVRRVDYKISDIIELLRLRDNFVCILVRHAPSKYEVVD